VTIRRRITAGVDMELLVRDAQPSDAEALLHILNPIIEARQYTAFDTAFSVDAERSYIVNLPPRGIWKVAVRQSDEALVGFQIVEPFATYTRAFDHVATIGTYVDLAMRRQGIATRLFTETFAEARRKGYEKFFTFVRADNSAALQTYLRHGFVVIGTATRHARIDGRYIDEVLIEKWLSRDAAS
jgi:L-amino acid N-acyltransferase YncA